jgi:hypothetical protein
MRGSHASVQFERQHALAPAYRSPTRYSQPKLAKTAVFRATRPCKKVAQAETTYPLGPSGPSGPIGLIHAMIDLSPAELAIDIQWNPWLAQWRATLLSPYLQSAYLCATGWRSWHSSGAHGAGCRSRVEISPRYSMTFPYLCPRLENRCPK